MSSPQAPRASDAPSDSGSTQLGDLITRLPLDIKAMIGDYLSKIDRLKLYATDTDLACSFMNITNGADKQDIYIEDEIPANSLITAYGDTQPKLREQIDTVTFTLGYYALTNLRTLAAQVSDRFVDHHLSVLHIKSPSASRGTATPSSALLSSRFSGKILLLSGITPQGDLMSDSDNTDQPCLFSTVVQRLEMDKTTGTRDHSDDKGLEVSPMVEHVVQGDGPQLVLLTTNSAMDDQTLETLGCKAALLLIAAGWSKSQQSITWACDGTPDDHLRIKEKVLTSLDAQSPTYVRKAVERHFTVCNVGDVDIDDAISLLRRGEEWEEAVRESRTKSY